MVIYYIFRRSEEWCFDYINSLEHMKIQLTWVVEEADTETPWLKRARETREPELVALFECGLMSMLADEV